MALNVIQLGCTKNLPPAVDRVHEYDIVCQHAVSSINVSWHPASRAFLNSTRKKGLCRNRVKSLLSMRKPLLGDSFKPRLSLDRAPRRHIDFRTEGSILTFFLLNI